MRCVRACPRTGVANEKCTGGEGCRRTCLGVEEDDGALFEGPRDEGAERGSSVARQVGVRVTRRPFLDANELLVQPPRHVALIYTYIKHKPRKTQEEEKKDPPQALALT